MHRAGGTPAVASFLKAFIAAQPVLQTLTLDDLNRVHEIILAYPRARFDLVDCCIMALSERLDIRHVATFDRRDFLIFHPNHCDYLELLP